MTINITVTNTYSKIDGMLDHSIVGALDDALSYDVSGAHFSSKVQQGLWDGRKHLFSRNTFGFPTGMLPHVMDILQASGATVTTTDNRTIPTHGPAMVSVVPPWDWQQTEVLNNLYQSNRGIIRIATGGGKGNIFNLLIGQYNIPTVILVHKRDLLYQGIDRMQKMFPGVEVGQIGDGVVNPKKFTVAMVQTVANAYKVKLERMEERDKSKITNQTEYLVKQCVENAQMEVADEVHAVIGDNWYKVQKFFKNAYYRHGYSATPFRTDKADMLLEAAFGPRVVDISCSDLIRKGFLARPKIYLVKFKHDRQAKHLSYAGLYDQEVVNNEERNFTIVKAATKLWKEGRRILITVTLRRHGELLEKMLAVPLGKENVRYVHGDSDMGLRKQTLVDLDNGTVRCVICTQIYGTGVDIRGLDCLINCKAQESEVDYTQIIGRTLRKTATKDKALILDIYDTGCRWLETHSKVRKTVVLREPEFKVFEIDSENV